MFIENLVFNIKLEKSNEDTEAIAWLFEPAKCSVSLLFLCLSHKSCES